MDQLICSFCRKPKANISCGICGCALCKNCEVFLETDHFSFLESIPENLTRVHYCPNCHDTEVAPASLRYEELMSKAKEVYIFFEADPSPPHALKKAKKNIIVKDCVDRDETILRLGFKAAEQNYNAVLYVSVTAKQVRHFALQKSAWQGTGLPAQIDEAKLHRR